MHPLEHYLTGMAEMRKRGEFRVPAGFSYSSFEEYVLEHGHLLESSALDEEEAGLVQEVLESSRPPLEVLTSTSSSSASLIPSPSSWRATRTTSSTTRGTPSAELPSPSTTAGW